MEKFYESKDVFCNRKANFRREITLTKTGLAVTFAATTLCLVDFSSIFKAICIAGKSGKSSDRSSLRWSSYC
jgi:hypothetical protein